MTHRLAFSLFLDGYQCCVWAVGLCMECYCRPGECHFCRVLDEPTKMIRGVRAKVSVVSTRPTISTLNDIFRARRFLISGTFSLWHQIFPQNLEAFQLSASQAPLLSLNAHIPPSYRSKPSEKCICMHICLCSFNSRGRQFNFDIHQVWW
jgi:hypothetical protein